MERHLICHGSLPSKNLVLTWLLSRAILIKDIINR